MSAQAKVAPTRPVGPDYRAESQKPAATVSTPVDFDTVTVLPQTPQLIALLSCATSNSAPCSPEWGLFGAHVC